MGSMILIRGVSGSGKTCFVEEFLVNNRDLYVIEADHFFYDNEECEYRFDANKLKEAHKWCLDTSRKVLEDGLDLVVSNTFTTEKELQPYFDLAKEFDYFVYSLVMENRHGSKDVHDVPETTRQRQASRLQQSIKLI